MPPTPKTAPIEMKKTQPLVTMPAPAKQTASVSVTPPAAEAAADQITAGLCWVLLGISALILIIQIWNYLI
jgi:hypothetical protein